MTNSSVLVLLLATVSVSGERTLPRIALVDFTDTEARALEDYLGHVVLVDFFAHWCAPCAREVPHLNELADDLGDRGFQVLGVTGDDAATAREWLSRHGARYPHARDAELALQIELGFRPLPVAVLLDPTGVIVWQGNPADLEPETIEALLDDSITLPAHHWPAEARAVRDALNEGRYAQATTLARTLEPGAGVAKLVQRFVERRGELMESALDAGDFLPADQLAAALEAGLAEGALRSRAAAVRKIIAEDPQARRTLEGQRELRELWRGVSAVATVAQADELGREIATLADRHRGTAVEHSASAHLETLTALKSILR